MYDYYFNILIIVNIQKSYIIYFVVVFYLFYFIIIINIIVNDVKIEFQFLEIFVYRYIFN